MNNTKPTDLGMAGASWDKSRAYVQKNHFDQYPEKWDSFRQSIREKGVTRPIKIAGGIHVWDGHHRVIVAAEEGLKTIPVRAMRKK